MTSKLRNFNPVVPTLFTYYTHICETSLDVLHELPTYFLERIDTEGTVFVGLARDLSLFLILTLHLATGNYNQKLGNQPHCADTHTYL